MYDFGASYDNKIALFLQPILYQVGPRNTGKNNNEHNNVVVLKQACLGSSKMDHEKEC